MPRGRGRRLKTAAHFQLDTKELSLALEGLESRVTQRGVLRRAAKAGIEPVAMRARAMVPVRSGKLRDSIRVVVGGGLRRKGKGAVTASVEEGGRAAPHAHFVERGTVKMAARPHLRPAFDSELGGMTDRVGRVLKVEIGKAAARRAKKLGLLP